MIKDEDIVAVDYMDVVRYVDAANTLVECIDLDITNGKEYTTKTIVALFRFRQSAQAMAPLIKQVESDRLKVN